MSQRPGVKPPTTRKPTFTAGTSLSSGTSGSAAGGSSTQVRKPATTTTTSSSASNVGRSQPTAAELAQTRRRLSIMGGGKGDTAALDGDKQYDDVDHADIIKQVLDNAEASERKEKTIFTQFHSLSKVGFVPYSSGKVNQDRACEVAPFGKSKDKAFFGVFDGHGQLGHMVSQYVATYLPKFIMKQKNLDTDIKKALENAFIACNSELAASSTDCTFSGTTACTVYISGNKIYCANAGDSRAVIGRDVDGKLKAVPLSSDHKPDREDEKARILQKGGRVEPCRNNYGAEIGPARVWLRNQDVPGLAMTRSFGDLVAASVGVVATPEVEEHTYSSEDKMLVMGSDGIWEFITSQEAIDIASKYRTPEAACKALVEEAETRWRKEEEVVDDITVIVIFF